MFKFPKVTLSCALVGTLLFSSCAGSQQASSGNTSDDKMAQNGTGARKTGMSKTAKGGLIGAGTGAAVGAVVGGLLGGGKGTAIGAIAGAAVGGTTGAVIGKKMDNQAKELQGDMAGARVERVGEGIKITFPAGILYDVNKADLKPEAQTQLTSAAGTLKKYADTNIVIEGHADASGDPAKNQTLSELRAQSVADFLASQGVDRARMTTKGYGSTQPVGDNATPEGKAANRRVEVAIFANEKMKKAAEKGEL